MIIDPNGTLVTPTAPPKQMLTGVHQGGNYAWDAEVALSTWNGIELLMHSFNSDLVLRGNGWSGEVLWTDSSHISHTNNLSPSGSPIMTSADAGGEFVARAIFHRIDNGRELIGKIELTCQNWLAMIQVVISATADFQIELQGGDATVMTLEES